MTTPTPEQLAEYERIAHQDSTPPVARAAIRTLLHEVCESHAHRAVLAGQIHNLRAELATAEGT